MRLATIYLAAMIFTAALLHGCSRQDSAAPAWETVDAQGSPTARHEAAFVAHDDKLYLIGGRRINPVDVYDPDTNAWTQKSKTPIEIHHFQAVTIGDKIYIIGAMTGGWPGETPLENVIIYHPKDDRFEISHPIPKDRRRGGAGAAVYNGKIYIIGGITNGHRDGYVSWFDEYDPATGAWRVLPDAPHPRDHFSAAVSGDKLYAFAGRRSEHAIGNNFGQTQKIGDVFNFSAGAWEPVTPNLALPTPRAGNMALAWNNEIIIGGGESDTQIAAHNEVQAFNTVSRTWRDWPALNEGRHGSAFAVSGGYLWTASGCAKRGGKPELTTLERIKLPLQTQAAREAAEPAKVLPAQNSDVQAKLHHALTLNFEGPATSETAAENPFTDYRLTVTFTQGTKSITVRGFYAADGRAGDSGAAAGNVWQARFMPSTTGEWSYAAQMRKGQNIAVSGNADAGMPIEISNAAGRFTVAESDKTAPDFRAPERGLLKAAGGYFQFEKSKNYWLKGGPNSPENLLAYTGFDGTYRAKKEAREGESSAAGDIHSFAPHLQDWNPGDPTWAGGKGKAIIGSMNYLAAQGMNTAYFLTMNIGGDGNDVWPYRRPDNVTRFDVSKLEQWNRLFDHMQAKGIMLHIVLQETENELWLDGGDTGPDRKLYLSELIARFAHHPALVWNLGEENGPVHWRPEGQDDRQRRDMTAFITAQDPYDHPILLHTHSQADEKDDIAAPLLGFAPLDGLSFQVAHRETVYAETVKWRKLAKEAGREWLITMDEIGPWYTGAVPDDMAGSHDALRRHVLWGHLLGGGAGVEWYFGGKVPGTDLSSEDWRTREQLWTQTRYALDFFERYLPYPDMTPCPGFLDRADVYCAAKPGEVYALYMPEGGSGFMKLPDGQTFTLHWFDPKTGGPLETGTIDMVTGENRTDIGFAPNHNGNDKVLLIRKASAP